MGVLDAPFRRRSVAVGVLGQSNEGGAVGVAEAAAYPQAFVSTRRPSVRVPLGPRVVASGGYLIKVHDDLYDAGWDPTIVNGGIGGLSFVKDAAGQMQFWAANATYYRSRSPRNLPDRGYAGDLIQVGGGIWRCMAGNDKVAISAGPDLTGAPGRGDGYIDTVTVFPGVMTPGIVPTQTVTIIGAPTGGSYILAGNSATTGAIAFNASAADVQTAIRTLGGPYSAATVTVASNVYTVVLNAGSSVQATMTLNTNSLTGGTAPTVIIAPGSFANYVTGASSPFPADANLTGYPRGTIITEVPASSANAGCSWRFEGFANGTPPLNSGGLGAWPLGAAVFNHTQGGMGFDPLGTVNRLHEEMQRVRADRKIIYLSNGQSDIAFSQAIYQAALTSLANFYLNRGYEVMVGLTNYSPSTGTAPQWATLVAARTAAVAALKAGADGARVHDGADLYTLMGTTGPMASGGAYLQADNLHLNGRGCVGPVLSGVQPAGKLVADAIKAVLAA